MPGYSSISTMISAGNRNAHSWPGPYRSNIMLIHASFDISFIREDEQACSRQALRNGQYRVLHTASEAEPLDCCITTYLFQK